MTIIDLLEVWLSGAAILFVMLVAAYWLSFPILGFGRLRPSIGRAALIVFLAFWLMAAQVAVAYPLGLGRLPSPWGETFILVALHGALVAMTFAMVTRNRRALLLVPMPFTGVLAALFWFVLI